MPQMKPMNWFLLFLTLNLIMMFMNILNYFFILKNKKMMNFKKKKTNKLNWKW